MLVSNSPLVLLFALVLQLHLAQATLAANCLSTPYNGHPKCNETCSKPARIPFANEFTCKVGGIIEWSDFNSSYEIYNAKVVEDTLSEECTAPLLTGISLHALPYPKSGFSPALKTSFNVSFLALFAKPVIKAVLLEFESPVYKTAGEESLTDKLYSIHKNNPEGGRKRLFNFSNFEPDSYDVENPITIDYPCLYGLDHCGGKVYTITLTSIMMAMKSSEISRQYFKCRLDTCITCNQTYTISVTPDRYNSWNRDSNTALNPNYENWKMTIATAFYPAERNILVLLEKPNIQFDFYSIRLVKNNRKVKEKNTTKTAHLFKSVPHGNYTVEVILCRHSGFCKHQHKYTTYHTITIDGKDSVIPTSDGHIVMTSLACVLGVMLAIFLLILLALCRRSRSKNSRSGMGIEEPAYVIISNDDPASIDISKKFACALDELGLNNVQYPRNNVDALECVRENNDLYLLIMLPVDHETFGFQISKDSEYEQILKSIFKSCSNFKNIVLIYFPYIKGAKRTQWQFLKKYKRIRLIKDYEKMMKLLDIKTKDARVLAKVKSDLKKATEEAKQTLIAYSKSSFIPNMVNYTEHIEMCPVHSPRPTVCPVHNVNSFQSQQHTCPCTVEQHLLNNNSAYLRQNEMHYPFLHQVGDMIPPSPLPSTKYQPNIGYQRVDSGYCSRMNSSSSNYNEICDQRCEVSLEDDDSLAEGMMEINSNLLPQSGQMVSEPYAINVKQENCQHEMSKDIQDIDRVFRINFC